MHSECLPAVRGLLGGTLNTRSSRYCFLLVIFGSLELFFGKTSSHCHPYLHHTRARGGCILFCGSGWALGRGAARGARELLTARVHVTQARSGSRKLQTFAVSSFGLLRKLPEFAVSSFGLQRKLPERLSLHPSWGRRRLHSRKDRFRFKQAAFLSAQTEESSTTPHWNEA